MNTGARVVPSLNLSTGKSSEDGSVNWGVSSALQMDFKQFVIGASNSNLIIRNGVIKGVTSTSVTFVTNWKDQFIFYGWSYIRMLKGGAVTGLSVSANEMFMQGSGLTIAPSLITFITKPYQITRKQTFSPELYIIASPVSLDQRTGVVTQNPNISFFTGGGTDLRVTKTFKLNVNLKVNISTDRSTSPMTAFTVGSKINL